jgi:hypothetical protein
VQFGLGDVLAALGLRQQLGHVGLPFRQQQRAAPETRGGLEAWIAAQVAFCFASNS